MKKILVTLLVVAMVVTATPVAAAAQLSQPSFLFIEEGKNDVHEWWQDGYTRFSTRAPGFTMGLANEIFISSQLLELVGIRVVHLPSNDPAKSFFLFFEIQHPGNWVWVHVQNNTVLRVKSAHGLDLKELKENWVVRWQELGLPASSPERNISFGLFQLLLSQLGIGGGSLLPTISPKGEIVREGVLFLWVWRPLHKKG